MFDVGRSMFNIHQFLSRADSYLTMVVNQIPHAAIGKILYHFIGNEVMGKAQFDTADVIQLLQMRFIEGNFHTGHIVF